jgi:hypothetical protein
MNENSLIYFERMSFSLMSLLKKNAIKSHKIRGKK